MNIETDSEWNPYAIYEQEIESLRQQLAASQAREQRYSDALEDIRDAFLNKFVYKNAHFECVQHIRKELSEFWEEVLAIPQDTTALQSMIAKAGEVMRERAILPFIQDHCEYLGREITDAIRSMPGVTMEDLRV